MITDSGTTRRSPLTGSAAGEGSAEASQAVDSKKVWLLGPAVLLVLIFTAYCATLRFQFVYDDIPQILRNPAVHSWHYVADYFTRHVWNELYPSARGNYYRPVFLLWLLINHTLFGLSAFWWHLTSILAHLSVTLLLYILVLRLTLERFVAGVAALIFGLHPVHIEAVAWISGVTEPLAAGLVLLSLLCYLNYRSPRAPVDPVRNRRPLWCAAALTFYVLAMLAKETSLMLPVILLASESIVSSALSTSLTGRQMGRQAEGLALSGGPATGHASTREWSMKRALMRISPFLALTVLYLLVRTAVLGGLSHSVSQLSISTIVYTLPSVLCFYVRLLVWPIGLSLFYDIPCVYSPGLSNFLLPAVAVILATAALFWVTKRSGHARLAIVWIVAPMVPLMNLSVFPEGELVHDRYLYMPSIGIALLAALLARRITAVRSRLLFGRPAVQVVAVLLAASVLGVATASQNLNWSNDLLLYSRAAQVAPNNNTAANNLGNEMFQRGYYDEGIRLYQEALKRDPDFWLSNYNIGYSYYKLGKLGDAERYLRRAIAISPTDSDEFVYLGLTLSKMGRFEEAADSIRQALAIRKDARGYHFALGYVLKQEGDVVSALNEFKQELAYNPDQSAAAEEVSKIESGAGKE